LFCETTGARVVGAGSLAAGSAERRVSVQSEEDIVRARSLARDLAKRLGFGLVDQSRIATAVSELTRNVVRYATDGRGEVFIRVLSAPPTAEPRAPGRSGIEIVVADDGPGIADVAQAMREGFTSGTGMGMGLPGTRRLMDEMHIESAPGQGTTVTVRKWRR
jgi:serine/threonine-protein kinase RsbT